MAFFGGPTQCHSYATRSATCFRPWAEWHCARSAVRDEVMTTRNHNSVLSRLHLFISVLLVLLVAIPACAQSRWKLSMIDGGNGRKVGKFTSLAVDKDDNLHVGYFDEGRQGLRYGFLPAGGSQWYTMEVD